MGNLPLWLQGPNSAWNDIAQGNHARHFLNGILILDFTDNDPKLALKDGIIALQLHAGKPTWTEFKNIRIKGTQH